MKSIVGVFFCFIHKGLILNIIGLDVLSEKKTISLV
jgi:hypothetical protein